MIGVNKMKAVLINPKLRKIKEIEYSIYLKWFDEYVYEVAIHKDKLNEKEKEILNQEFNKELDPWDPMGSQGSPWEPMGAHGFHGGAGAHSGNDHHSLTSQQREHIH